MRETPPGPGLALRLPPLRGALGPRRQLDTQRGDVGWCVPTRAAALVFTVLPKICQCMDVILLFQKFGNVLGTLRNPRSLHEAK